MLVMMNAACVEVDCPDGSTGTVPGSLGTGGTSGCTADKGYEGQVSATTTDPFYSSSLAGDGTRLWYLIHQLWRHCPATSHSPIDVDVLSL